VEKRQSCIQDKQHLYMVAAKKTPIFGNIEACNNTVYITIQPLAANIKHY